MIRYALLCEREHAFDAWFGNSAAFDAQEAKGQVICPQCGTAKVRKAPMRPNLATGSHRGSPGPGSGRKPAQGETTRHLGELARRIREHVIANADDVGPRFAEEARKIHHEEAEPRGIYGQTTAEEAGELREEGIPVHPLPNLPEDHN